MTLSILCCLCRSVNFNLMESENLQVQTGIHFLLVSYVYCIMHSCIYLQKLLHDIFQLNVCHKISTKCFRLVLLDCIVNI